MNPLTSSNPTRYDSRRLGISDENKNNISELPEEIIQHVFSFLPSKDQHSVVQVNRAWKGSILTQVKSERLSDLREMETLIGWIGISEVNRQVIKNSSNLNEIKQNFADAKGLYPLYKEVKGLIEEKAEAFQRGEDRRQLNLQWMREDVSPKKMNEEFGNDPLLTSILNLDGVATKLEKCTLEEFVFFAKLVINNIPDTNRQVSLFFETLDVRMVVKCREPATRKANGEKIKSIVFIVPDEACRNLIKFRNRG